MRNVVATGIAITSIAAVAPAARAEIRSCPELASHLGATEKRGWNLGKVRAFERAVEALDRPELSDCNLALVGRARFGYADALDHYARSFAKSSSAAREWSRKTAEAYDAYLAWFQSLDPARVDKAIRELKGAESAPAEQFDSIRGDFLRARVGGAIHNATQSFVRAKEFDRYFDALERYQTLPIEAFPKQVVEEWHRWLLTQPDFRHERDETVEVDAIREVIRRDDRSRFNWDVFVHFLERYARQGDAYRTRWAPVRDRVSTWLAS
jgi:hypothetical protein